MFMPK